MMYNYEVRYSNGTVVKNVYSMDERKAFEMMGKEVAEHFLHGDQKVSIISAKVVGVR